jgi:hypothetical protein
VLHGVKQKVVGTVDRGGGGGDAASDASFCRSASIASATPAGATQVTSTCSYASACVRAAHAVKVRKEELGGNLGGPRQLVPATRAQPTSTGPRERIDRVFAH